MAGRIVRFTPNGLDVRRRISAMSWSICSTVPHDSAVSMPSPPASDTATHSSTLPMPVMPDDRPFV